VKGLSLRNVSFRAPVDEWRPTLVCDDIRQLTVSGFTATSIQGGVPVIGLTNIDRGWISGAVAPAGSRALVDVEGAKTKDVLISGCDLRDAAQPFEAIGITETGAVREEANILNVAKG
jgi:hypothetical protein